MTKVSDAADAGRIVLAKSDEILRLYDKIFEALGDEQSLAGRLKLGAIQTVLSGVLPDALAALNRDHPRAKVHVAAGMSLELALQVASGDLDAAITTGPVKPVSGDFVWTPLYEDSFWLVAPPGGTERSVRKLLTSFPFIRFDSRAWAGRMIERELRHLRLDVREEMVLDSQEVILRMVEKGLGVAIVPLSDEVRNAISLTFLPFGDPQLVRKVVLLERPDRSGGRLAAALATLIRDAKSVSSAG